MRDSLSPCNTLFSALILNGRDFFFSAKRSSRITLSPSYTKSEFSTSIDLVSAWPYNGKIVVESFRKEIFDEAEEIHGG